ncbi:MAG: radical SAM protein [Pseudomonadota bacterium]
MLTHSYSAGVRFFRHLGLPLLRLSLRGLFSMNRYALFSVLRLALWRAWRWLPRWLQARRDGLAMPVTLQVVDDTRCGARCTHCLFSAFTDRGAHLTLEDLGRLLDQAAGMDIGHVYLMGADPFHRRDPAAYLALLAAHPHQVFYLFTEGQRLSDEHLERLRRAGNIVPMLNVDGLEQATEARKGEGAWGRVSALMGRLHARRVPWFVTTMVSTANFEHVTSEAYLEHLAARGAWIVAYLPYTPVDAHAEADLVLSEAQLGELYHRSLRLNSWRRKLVVLDMLGIERELTSCPAGLETITVYHDGTVAPCAALPLGHRASNVKEKPLRELFLTDPLYVAMRAARRNGPLHCLHYGDTTLLADHLETHGDAMVVLNPDTARWLREHAG